SEGDTSVIAVESARAYHYDTLIDIPVTTAAGKLTVTAERVPSEMLISPGVVFLALIVLVLLVAVLVRRRRRPA
ncbi:MAG: hypothetical protein WBB22_07560, partial [Anaerolineae bacterium]